MGWLSEEKQFVSSAKKRHPFRKCEYKSFKQQPKPKRSKTTSLSYFLTFFLDERPGCTLQYFLNCTFAARQNNLKNDFRYHPCRAFVTN